MTFTDELPTEVGTEFICIWDYELGLDCNLFMVGKRGILVMNEECDYLAPESHLTLPWEAEVEIEYKLIIK